MAVSEEALMQVSDQLARARELAVAGANATYDEADRKAAALEVDQILETVLAAANRELDGRAVFAGTASAAPAVEAVRDADGRIVDVRFPDGAEAVSLRVEGQLEIEAGLLAREVFGVTDRGAPRYSGETGAQPSVAAGADTGRGREFLQVEHVRTLYGDGLGPGGTDSVSGVGPGASAADDTVLGPLGAHTLWIEDTSAAADGSSGTVSLNGGEAVRFDAGNAADVVVVGPQGERVSLDLRALTPGFSGAVAIGGEGTLSTDDGASTVPIDFSTQQTVVSSVDDSRLHVDTSQVRRAGIEVVDHPGTRDVFATLIALRDALEGRATGGQSDQLEEIGNRLEDLDLAERAVTDALGVIGARRSALETVGERVAEQRVRLESLRSEIEDVDLIAALTELQARQTAFERALQAGARAIRPSIMDFLR